MYSGIKLTPREAIKPSVTDWLLLWDQPPKAKNEKRWWFRRET